MSIRDAFIAEIEAFLVLTDMTAVQFGYLAVRDPSWFVRFRNGKDALLGSVERVRAYMDRERPDRERYIDLA